MTTEEITQIGKALARRRLKYKLWLQLRIERPTLSRNTMDRAFEGSDILAETELLEWIREEGAAMIAKDDQRIQAEKAAKERENDEPPTEIEAAVRYTPVAA